MEQMRMMMNDPNIPGGLALGVALAIAVRIRWGNPSSPVPTHAIADRMGVSREYAADVLTLLVHLGYLVPTDTKRNRKMFMATIPGYGNNAAA
jgi:hypothetical protein